MSLAALAIAIVALLGAALALFMLRRSDPALGDLALRVAALERPKAPAAGVAEHARALGRLDDRVSQLESRVSIVVAQRTGPTEPKSAPIPQAAAPAADGLILAKPATVASPESQPAAAPVQADAQWVTGLLANFSRMVEEGGAAVDAFITRYEPVGAAVDGIGAGYVLGEDSETAMLWAVSAEPRLYALLPGPRAVNNWGAHFAPSRKSTAQEQLGATFELTPDTPGFAVRSAAWAAADDGRRLTLKRKGRLDGFTS
jgi:hypothetical protein